LPTGVGAFSSAYAPTSDGSCLVSCCPSLQCLMMGNLQSSAELLAPLQQLSSLHTVCLVDAILTVNLKVSSERQACSFPPFVLQFSFLMHRGVVCGWLTITHRLHFKHLANQAVPTAPAMCTAR
jgi:hypothetical protein